MGCHPFESQLIAVEKHGGYQGLAEAAGNTQNSPLMGSLREKGGQHPILEVYYFHIRAKSSCYGVTDLLFTAK